MIISTPTLLEAAIKYVTLCAYQVSFSFLLSLSPLPGQVENWPLMNFLEVRENLICLDERISSVPKDRHMQGLHCSLQVRREGLKILQYNYMHHLPTTLADGILVH